jgi:hypothetical protein
MFGCVGERRRMAADLGYRCYRWALLLLLLMLLLKLLLLLLLLHVRRHTTPKDYFSNRTRHDLCSNVILRRRTIFIVVEL